MGFGVCAQPQQHERQQAVDPGIPMQSSRASADSPHESRRGHVLRSSVTPSGGSGVEDNVRGQELTHSLSVSSEDEDTCRSPWRTLQGPQTQALSDRWGAGGP